MIERTVEEMYRDDERNRFLEVTYQNGDKEVMYFKDFASGAMIENIVRRAKKLAIKRLIADGGEGHPHRRPPGVDPPGVQGARGPAEHHQPRRLGEDLGQEGRAHRLRAHAHLVERGRAGRRPRHRTGRHGPVPLAARIASGDRQDLRGRDRVRDHRPRHRRVEPHRRLVGPHQRLRERVGRQRPGRRRPGGLGLRGRVTRATTPGGCRPRARSPPRSRPTWSTPC